MCFPIWSKIQMWPIQATTWSLTFPVFSCTRCCLHPLYVTLCAESVATICTIPVPYLYHGAESITAISCYQLLSVSLLLIVVAVLLQMLLHLQSRRVFCTWSSSGGTPHAAARSATCEIRWETIKEHVGTVKKEFSTFCTFLYTVYTVICSKKTKSSMYEEL